MIGGVGPLGPVIVVRPVRVLHRLLFGLVVTVVSLVVTAAVVWVAVIAGGGLGRGGDLGGADGEIVPRVVEVPEAWPETLTPPAGATVTTAVVTAGGTPDEQLLLVYEVGQDPAATAAALRTQLGAAGLRITGDATTADGTGSLTATGAGYEATVVVRPTPARPGVTTVSWVLRPGLR